MLFNRQKLLLALLDALGGELGARDFQKHLFLYTRLCERERSFEFLPYRFGCYSFQAAADKRKLVNQGCLTDESGWRLERPALSYVRALPKDDQSRIATHIGQHGKLMGDDLVRHVYKNYPYYATRSEIAEQLMSKEDYRKIVAARPTKRRKSTFFTIGYEGKSIETYVNQLIENDVRLLVDVRKNPLSRKYGFSKGALSSLCERFDIDYVHIPKLGIPGMHRQNLESQADYDRLFLQYKKDVLPQSKDALDYLSELLARYKRIAITCFERDHEQCHRSCVAEAIADDAPQQVAFAHL